MTPLIFINLFLGPTTTHSALPRCSLSCRAWRAHWALMTFLMTSLSSSLDKALTFRHTLPARTVSSRPIISSIKKPRHSFHHSYHPLKSPAHSSHSVDRALQVRSTITDAKLVSWFIVLQMEQRRVRLPRGLGLLHPRVPPHLVVPQQRCRVERFWALPLHRWLPSSQDSFSSLN